MSTTQNSNHSTEHDIFTQNAQKDDDNDDDNGCQMNTPLAIAL